MRLSRFYSTDLAPCPYLPDRQERRLVALVDAESGNERLDLLTEAGFRRSQGFLYKPVCPGCRACVPVRIAVDAFRPEWMSAYVALWNVTPVLAAGAASALAAVFVPDYARLFLRPARRDREVRQYAQCLFLEHDLCRTRSRTAVLLLVARFERKVELCADTGFSDRVSAADWHGVVDATTTRLAQGDCAGALMAGLARVEDILRERGYVGDGTAPDEIPDAPLEAAGS